MRVYRNLNFVTCINTKGGLISEFFSLWLKSPKKGVKSLPEASSVLVDSAQESDLAPFFEDMSQSKNSEIKPPLPGKIGLCRSHKTIS